MIQRIQTVYYGLAVLMLAIPLMGMNLVSFSTASWSQEITFFGNKDIQAAMDSDLAPLPNLPLFWLNVVLIILLLLIIASYKNLKRQQSLGRITFWATGITILVLGFAIFNFMNFTRVLKPEMHIGVGFYMVIAAFILVFLGNQGVKNDRKLLDSLNRLR